MNDVFTIRCSALPLGFICPGSLRSDAGVLVDAYNDAAETGDDVHRLLAMAPEGDAPKPLVDELPKEARILYYTGAKLWREHISAWMPNSLAEEAFEDDDGSGHTDRHCISDDGKRAVVLDWKTGRKDISHKHQGFGYARRLFVRHPTLEVVTVHFAWIREQELESYTVSRARSDEWEQKRRAEVIEWDGVFHPGDHCDHCRRIATCPARAEMNRQSLALVTSGQVLDLATMPGPALAGLYRRLSPLASQIKSLQDAIRSEANARGGIDDGEGRVLHYKQVKGPREVDALKAWPVLTERLSDEELAACLTVRIGEVEETVAAKAGRGAGAEAKRKLAKALEDAGAIKQTTVDRWTDERK